jgi:3-phenylpropionate/trans-cinnamate dioxygenase ferredoxin subunit
MLQWIRVCATDEIDQEDVRRFDHAGRTFAVYRGPDDRFYCTDGLCTHEAVHLADGFVMDFVVECPKHQGEFDYRTGETVRMPPCRNLKTYPARVEGDAVFVEV